jgi:hypothetical protein
VFSSNSFSVAKLKDADKKQLDALDGWSKARAQALAKENNRINDRTLNALARSFDDDWFSLGFFRQRRLGFWLYSSGSSCYTFIPYYRRHGSPYGGGYSRSIFAGGLGYWGWDRGFGGSVYGSPVRTIPDRGSSNTIYNSPATRRSGPSVSPGAGAGRPTRSGREPGPRQQ